MRKVLIVGGGLAPHFNEAMANQIRLLSEKINANVITCNDIGWLPFKKMDRYLIINTKFVMNRTPLLSLINGALFYIVVKIYERKSDVIYIPGGFDSKFLDYLNLKKCTLIVTSIPFINEEVERKIKKYSQKLQGIITQSKRTENQLINLDINRNKLSFLFPLIDLEKFKYSPPPPLDEFKILFASAPNLEIPGENNFQDKGVTLLLEAFKEFMDININTNSILLLLWRGKYTEMLNNKICELNLQHNVKIIDDIVHMPEIYSNIHVTVIPYLNLLRSPELPMSAIESLASGRPVVSTNVAEIADIITKYKCGCVSKPQKNDFAKALDDCRREYSCLQLNCKNVYESDIY